MSETSGMAAVDAAAATINRADHERAVAQAREEGRQSGHAAGRTEGEQAGREAGATAERERILGIERAALPGHAELVAKLKADPKASVGDAALQINAAERAKLEAAGKAIRGVEDTTGKVTAAPASERRDDDRATAASTPDGWKAEYAASAELRAEFPTAESYVAYQQAKANGQIRERKARAA